MSGLALDAVSKDFDGVHALRDVSLAVGPGEVVGLVGPNGSGKSTLVNIITGTLRASSGRLTLDGTEIAAPRADRLARAGILRTYQALRLFEAMSVIDNVMVGAQRDVRPSLTGALVRTPRSARREAGLRDSAMKALDAVGLGSASLLPVAVLSHGQRRRVELARALAARPRYLVLDEPGAGVDPEQVEIVVALIGKQRDAGIGVLLVEHDLGLVDRLASRVVGLDGGSVVAAGPLSEVVAHPALAVLNIETQRN